MYGRTTAIWLGVITLAWIISYGTIYAYKYATTTTLEDVTEKARLYEKAESDLVQAKLEYCYDNRLDSKKCEEVMVGSWKLDTWTASGTPISSVPSQGVRMLICKKVPNSPLCNKENYEMAQAIAYKKALIWGIDDKEKFFRVGIGIMNSESTLWTKYAWTCDSSYNNFGWIKYRILDTWEAVRDQKIPQGKNNWCWVYKFATMEDYFGSKYNSLWKWYGACFKKKDAVNCIAFAYVWNPNVAETSWQANVNVFVN